MTNKNKYVITKKIPENRRTLAADKLEFMRFTSDSVRVTAIEDGEDAGTQNVKGAMYAIFRLKGVATKVLPEDSTYKVAVNGGPYQTAYHTVHCSNQLGSWTTKQRFPYRVGDPVFIAVAIKGVTGNDVYDITPDELWARLFVEGPSTDEKATIALGEFYLSHQVRPDPKWTTVNGRFPVEKLLEADSFVYKPKKDPLDMFSVVK